MSYAYIRNGLVVHVSGVGSEPVEGAYVVEIADNIAVTVGDTHDGTAFSAAIDVPQIIDVITFKMLFPVDRAAAIEAARATDGKIDWFLKLLDDPRTTTVNRALPYVQNTLDYLISVSLLSAEEKVAILAYQP